MKAHEVAHADQLPILVRRAFNDAQAAPTGPVFLSLLMDVMEEMSSAGAAMRAIGPHTRASPQADPT